MRVEAALPFQIRLFGPFEVSVSGQPPPRLRLRKSQALLALLALRGGAAVERDWLLGLLWPEQEGAQALRNCLSHLRQALGPEAGRLVSPTFRTLALDLADAFVDVLAFDAALARGDAEALAEAVALYRGQLLEGWSEEWVFQERQVREQGYLAARERLAALALERGEPAAAERHLQLAVAADPLRESAQRALMAALAAGGNYAAALLAYRELRQRLHRELNAEPDPETQTLFQRLREEARGKAGARIQTVARAAGDEASTASDRSRVGTLPLRTDSWPLPAGPSGTLTFLFTDIEGSTRLWEQHSDAMQHALAQHDHLLRETVEHHGGAVFKTFGDQCCAVFGTAPAALAAAVTAQHALQAEPWETIGRLRVRMALHTGVTHERGGDYFGSTLNRVARLLEAGHGGQVLLSGATQELVRDDLPEGADLLDLGEHLLKDLTRAEQIYQVVHPDLPGHFPPLVSLSRRLHNLPAQPTTLLGRDKQVAELAQRLQREEPRLLTLTGPGGIGKSRLQLQVAVELLDQFPDGVWRVELAPLADPSLVLPTVASVLGLQELPGSPLLQSLTDWLRQRSLLLVLDNCEHVLEACSQLAAALLRASPGLCILASSREPLSLAGEVRWRISPLETPDPKTLSPARAAAAVARYPAAQLFVERATAVAPSFALTDQNALAVAQVCHRLDGMPLAIELAAARVNVLSVEQIGARLDDFSRLLTNGGRTALRSTIDWSYELLSEPERVLMRRLAVFVGGWTLEAAEAVCSDFGFRILDFGLPTKADEPGCPASLTLSDPIQNPKSKIQNEDVLDLLTLLVDKSLVLSEDTGKTVRYRFPETVRQYGRERLLESGEAAVVQDRQRDYFLMWAERMEPLTYGCAGPGWQDVLEGDLGNLRAALDWLVVRQETPTGLGWGPVLVRYWRHRGPASEGLQRLKQILALPCAQEPWAARGPTLMTMGELAYQQADYPLARALFEESLTRYHALGNRGRVLACYSFLAMIARDSGDYPRARSYYAEMAAAAEESEEGEGGRPAQAATAPTADKDRGSWLSSSLLGRGYVAYLEGDLDTAQALLEESLAIYRERGHGHASHVGWLLTHLAEAADGRGDYQTAEMLLTQTLDMWRESSHRQEQESHAFALQRLGRVRHHQGDAEAARAHYTEALAILQAHGSRRGIAECLEGLAGVAAAQGRPADAARLIGAAELLRELIGAPLPPVERSEHDRRMATVQAQLGEASFAAAWARGRSISLRQAIAEALEGAPAG